MLLDGNLNNIYMSFMSITFSLKSSVSAVCILKLMLIPLASMVPLLNLQMNANMGFHPGQFLKGSGYMKWLWNVETQYLIICRCDVSKEMGLWSRRYRWAGWIFSDLGVVSWFVYFSLDLKVCDEDIYGTIVLLQFGLDFPCLMLFAKRLSFSNTTLFRGPSHEKYPSISASENNNETV